MNEVVQHFHFEPGTLIEYDGYSVVVTGSTQNGLIVRDRYVGDEETARFFVLSDKIVNELLGRLDVVIDQNFSCESPADVQDEDGEVEWVNRPEDERRTATQKEAWCLSIQSVLKTNTYKVSDIAANYAEIRDRAETHMRVNALGSNKSGEFVFRDWGVKSLSNFCKAYFAMKRPHPRSLLIKRPKGNTTKRLPSAVDALLDQSVSKYLSKSQPSKASIVRYVRKKFASARCERLANGDVRPFKTPHENTVYARLARFTRLQLVIGRDGYRAAQKEFSPTQHGVRALKPGELIEIDFWKGDVFTLSEESGFWDLLTPDIQKTFKEGKPKGKKKVRQRIWVCAAIDVATRMIVGLGIAETPNARTVIEVLDMVMRDKSDLSHRADCTMPWWQHCGLGTVIMDTGAEFFNDDVKNAILALGGSYIYGRTAVPMDKPFVERLFGGMRTMWADEMPGKTGFSINCLIDYDSQKMAVFRADEFRLMLIRYGVDYYPLQENEGLGKRPIDAWSDAQKYGAIPAPQPRVRRNATGLKLQRRLTKEGVRILGIPFADPQSFPKIISNGKRTVEVRLDPNDLREITIVVDGKQIHLQNQRPDLEHHSLRTLMAAIKKMRETRPQDKVFYEYVLAKHAEWFADKIATGIQGKGLPSTEISAREVDRFEGDFCLRLQIDKDPERAVTADLDQLLSGGTGDGIYTPADIAAERSAATERVISDSPDEPAGEVEQTGHLQSSTADHPPKQDDVPHAATNPTTQPRSSKAKKPPTGRSRGAPKGKGKFK